MKVKTYPENFNVTLRRGEFETVKEYSAYTGNGLYRELKNYLEIYHFPHMMLRGDYVRIIYLEETEATVKILLHLNNRLLVKAKEMAGSEGLYAATRQRGKNPLGGTEPTAAD